MPVSKSLGKIQKRMKASSKQNVIHPRGRKFQQLNKATLREGKIAEKKKAHHDKKSHELSRVGFIQNAINIDALKEKPFFSHEETALFIEQFIARDDEELNDLKKKRRSNRPPTNRQLLLQQKRDIEEQEFKKGFLCPDLTDEKNVEFIRKWNKTFGGVTNMKLIRINNKGEQVLNSITKTNDVEMS
ncbi:hypothetical protein TPHA_0G01520 [Tetrapisispora phaffii CBS 4417]|uniref:Translation machinery-associated protein 16 n=1 Tax=Tetrapisispora phaffii (strain ATCC 24235 / CBS 4417 / NBRC 1672 / NRRL Y-8282 / UCD 70-5) TaxID=1071381 RepID=G8BVR0_TETPH|nr:hypothetical protein TPHA_0G01520 [Tetrapisispora phaffii CBS 4417]CCE63988.1 hypothetical protein TPHA_0G01520 [Tetrapisispora phaffii CBS 4417]